MSLWGCNFPLPALAACHRRGMVCSRLSLFSALFCVWAWQCLRLGLVFHMIVIPQSGLLAQVNSFRLHSGHSGQILTLSNAACTSLPSPCLLVAAAGFCTVSPPGVTVGHVICGFKLFIYFSSHLCCPLSFQGSPQTHQ